MGTGEETASTPIVLRCAECGERVVRQRLRGGWAHKSRHVAACDLDSDHVPAPDWKGLGEVPCRTCGAPTAWTEGETFAHVDEQLELNHPADPLLPPL